MQVEQQPGDGCGSHNPAARRPQSSLFPEPASGCHAVNAEFFADGGFVDALFGGGVGGRSGVRFRLNKEFADDSQFPRRYVIPLSQSPCLAHYTTGQLGCQISLAGSSISTLKDGTS